MNLKWGKETKPDPTLLPHSVSLYLREVLNTFAFSLQRIMELPYMKYVWPSGKEESVPKHTSEAVYPKEFDLQTGN